MIHQNIQPEKIRNIRSWSWQISLVAEKKKKKVLIFEVVIIQAHQFMDVITLTNVFRILPFSHKVYPMNNQKRERERDEKFLGRHKKHLVFRFVPRNWSLSYQYNWNWLTWQNCKLKISLLHMNLMNLMTYYTCSWYLIFSGGKNTQSFLSKIHYIPGGVFVMWAKCWDPNLPHVSNQTVIILLYNASLLCWFKLFLNCVDYFLFTICSRHIHAVSFHFWICILCSPWLCVIWYVGLFHCHHFGYALEMKCKASAFLTILLYVMFELLS